MGCVSRRTVVLSAPAGAAAMSAPIADDVTTEAPAVRAKPPAGDGDLGKMRAYWCGAAPVSGPSGPLAADLLLKLQRHRRPLVCSRAWLRAACLHTADDGEAMPEALTLREARAVAHILLTTASNGSQQPVLAPASCKTRCPRHTHRLHLTCWLESHANTPGPLIGSATHPRRVAERVVAWRVPAADADGRRRSFALHHSAAASLRLGANGSVEGADETLELSTSEGAS